MYLWKEMVGSQQSELEQEGRNAVVVVDNHLPNHWHHLGQRAGRSCCCPADPAEQCSAYRSLPSSQKCVNGLQRDKPMFVRAGLGAPDAAFGLESC